ncbi:unnamed protein product [marine sediment metagenome]|uniref:Uncharacterized protein n=1 Tax=marine sediment metagenome TaxID=412755 RepID=X1JQ22_9ZZZZ
MSKGIKLEDQVYYQLEEIRGKRETFSHVVERLLAVMVKANELIDALVDREPPRGEEVDHV